MFGDSKNDHKIQAIISRKLRVLYIMAMYICYMYAKFEHDHMYIDKVMEHNVTIPYVKKCIFLCLET